MGLGPFELSCILCYLHLQHRVDPAKAMRVQHTTCRVKCNLRARREDPEREA